MRSRLRILTFVSVLGVLIAACGGSETEGSGTTGKVTTTIRGSITAPPTTTVITTTSEAPTTTAATTTTGHADAELPLTAGFTFVTEGYFFGAQGGPATDDDLPFTLGSIGALWYRGPDFYVVVYDGLDLESTGPLCPGNSIFTDSFQFASNAPTEGADCSGAPNVAAPPHGVYNLCTGQIAYLTQIPSNLLGTLYASIEIYGADGVNRGATSAFLVNDLELIGEIDLDAYSC